jgi:hypothetical protein
MPVMPGVRVAGRRTAIDEHIAKRLAYRKTSNTITASNRQSSTPIATMSQSVFM